MGARGTVAGRMDPARGTNEANTKAHRGGEIRKVGRYLGILPTRVVLGNRKLTNEEMVNKI